MDENTNLTKKYRMNFSEENRLRNFHNKDAISALNKKNYIKNSNTCFNKTNINKDITTINNSEKKEHNIFLLADKKFITPIKIQKDENYSKFLPILEND